MQSVLLQSKEFDFHRLEPEKFTPKLLILAVWLSFAVAGIALTDGSVKIASQFLLGLALAHQTELIHELLHQLATGNSKVDRFIGRILGIPVGVSFWFYRYWHLWHHGHVGTEEDQESFGYAYSLLTSRSRFRRLFGLLLHLSMLAHFSSTLRRMGLSAVFALAPRLLAKTPRMPRSTALRIQTDYQLMTAWSTFLVIASCVDSSLIIIDFWLIPLLFWAPVHALIELPEHFECDNPEEDVCKNTRSIKTTGLLAWFVNGNCYHLGHHYDMLVPISKLGPFEQHIRLEHSLKHEESSYTAFFRRFFTYIWTRRGFDSKPGLEKK